MDTSTLNQAIQFLQTGDWDNCHKLVQDQRSPSANWLHAILHRIEGDHSNAAYWYRKAEREPSNEDPMTELAQLESTHLTP